MVEVVIIWKLESNVVNMKIRESAAEYDMRTDKWSETM